MRISVHLERQGLPFVVLGLVLGALLIAAGQQVYVVQGVVGELAALLPVGYAFGAGMVATANPCGVLLLPSLVAYYLGQGDTPALGGWQRAMKALLLGLMATLGFVALFGLVGMAIGAGGRALAAAFPIGGLMVGIALAALGLWLAATGRELGIVAASGAMGRVQLRQDLTSPFLFGVAYAVASLACTLPIFLVVAGSALAAGEPLAAAVRLVSYALGMGSVLTAVALWAAFFESAVAHMARAVVPYVHRLAASFLIGAGLFVANYWLTTGGLLGRPG